MEIEKFETLEIQHVQAVAKRATVELTTVCYVNNNEHFIENICQ